MRTFFNLLKINLNLNFGISALKYRFTKEKKRLWEPILIGLCVILGLGFMTVTISFLMFAIFLAGKQVNKPEMVLTLAVLAGQFLILFFGILYVMSSFYFSPDLNILIPLPLKPSQVLGSKFAVIMINEYLTLLPMLLPAIVIYGAGMRMGFLYWVKGLLIFLAAPVIPLIIGSLLIMILMRFINFRKSKDLLAVIGGIFGVIISLSVNYFMQSFPKVNEEEIVNNLLSGQFNLIEMIGQRFPPSIWATYALSKPGLEGLGYLALFLGMSVILFAALMWLGNQIFYKSVLSGQEVSRKHKALSKEEIGKKYVKTSSAVSALFWREWKLFLRTPVYAMNGIAGMVIAPFAMLIPILANKEIDKDKMLSFIQNPDYILPISLVGLAIMLFTSSMNIVASTSVSREGQMFWISKMIPVHPKEQVTAKLIHGIAIQTIGVLVTGAVFAFVTRISFLHLLALLLLGVIGTVGLVAINLLIDVLRPKLDWKNPQEAVKSNMNGFLGMLATFAILGVLSAAAVGMVLLNLPHWLIYLLLGILMIIFAVALSIGLFAVAEYKYPHIEA
ncbi:hypothetical protein CDQ84_00050 [Clostridium thermosuccinogenes]|uniref:Uncharacterized protein n=1 Tax=Clostridium thermosuccinogenes TaxID=84032 RepID=A0A2K2FRM8_9CLOT|nr:hypothetical protein [Pseudoclostridium thermosuccinogenes]AUS97821.1 hypothetical protein CDO33_16040 [Pseudoclostridium thermosuccinogenes]PNU00117.1 hypothetical protein CDQ85_00050 [Pseudoclostridium thermosuccinogenes]PNU01442.1 hypothetical protein CDQ84_00050 [Pseudoclostridium thermosuccinogenes]